MTARGPVKFFSLVKDKQVCLLIVITGLVLIHWNWFRHGFTSTWCSLIAAFSYLYIWNLRQPDNQLFKVEFCRFLAINQHHVFYLHATFLTHFIIFFTASALYFDLFARVQMITAKLWWSSWVIEVFVIFHSGRSVKILHLSKSWNTGEVKSLLS